MITPRRPAGRNVGRAPLAALGTAGTPEDFAADIRPSVEAERACLRARAMGADTADIFLVSAERSHRDHMPHADCATATIMDGRQMTGG